MIAEAIEPRRPTPATPRSASRSRAPCSPSPGPRRRRARGRRDPAPGPATWSPPAAQAPARPWRAPPSSSRCCADAGVVDAGGRGVCVILDAAETVLTGRADPSPSRTAVGTRHIPTRLPDQRPHRGRPGVRGDVPPRRRGRPDPRPQAGPGAARRLARRGRRRGPWNVHVHVDDVGAAIEAGIDAGRPHRVRVTHFAEQVAAARAGRPPAPAADRRGRRRAGLAALFEEAGAVVVDGGPGRRPVDRDAARGDHRVRCRRGRRAAQRPRLRARRRDRRPDRRGADEGRPGRRDPHRGPGPGARRARRPRARPLPSTPTSWR